LTVKRKDRRFTAPTSFSHYHLLYSFAAASSNFASFSGDALILKNSQKSAKRNLLIFN